MTTFIQSIENNRERFLDLLLLADPSTTVIRQYLNKGYLFVLLVEGKTYGAVHLLPRAASVMEIKNIAVKEEVQGQGYGKRLLQHALDFCQVRGYERVIVGTGNSSIDNLAFYQKAGFRFFSVIRNFFTLQYDQSIFEHGIQCRDLILLDITFPPQR